VAVFALNGYAVRGCITAVRGNGDLVREMEQQLLSCLVKEHGVVKEHDVSWVRPPCGRRCLLVVQLGKGLREELRNWVIRSRITDGEDRVPQPAASGHQYWIHLLEINDQTRILPLGTAATKIRG
jgi:hypothetical protein